MFHERGGKSRSEIKRERKGTWEKETSAEDREREMRKMDKDGWKAVQVYFKGGRSVWQRRKDRRECIMHFTWHKIYLHWRISSLSLILSYSFVRWVSSSPLSCPFSPSICIHACFSPFYSQAVSSTSKGGYLRVAGPGSFSFPRPRQRSPSYSSLRVEFVDHSAYE